MSIAEPAPAPAGDSLPEDAVCVGRYPDDATGFEHGLVVLAMGRSCWLVPAGSDHRLWVSRSAENHVRAELARFDAESAAWPPRFENSDRAPPSRPRVSPLLWALTVLAAFWLKGRSSAFVALGSLDAAGVYVRGEWWRPLTALFLHGDAGHLVSNIIPGVFVFSWVLATLGPARGWGWLALTAFGANLASAALHLPGPYAAVGASTAVFAGLGLLTGSAATRARAATSRTHRWRGVFVPVGAGAILLALYGAGGPRVDLGAHLTGFVAGLVGGILAELGSRNFRATT